MELLGERSGVKFSDLPYNTYYNTYNLNKCIRIGIRTKMVEKQKKHLTLNIDSEIANKAVADPNIKVSEITEKVLRAFTASSKTADKEKLYSGYQELFKLMLPLLQKFQVRTLIGNDIASWTAPDIIDVDSEGEPILGSPEPDIIFGIHLEPDGKLYHEEFGKVEINDINIEVFLRPQEIIDKFLDSIQEGVNYRKEQFKEIEMAKTIIDVITKGTIPKSKKSKGKKK